MKNVLTDVVSVPDFGHNSLSKSSPKKDRFMARDDSIVRVGKRFVKASQDDDSDAKDVTYESHEKSKVYFARAHQRKTTREEEVAKERLGRRQAQVNLPNKELYSQDMNVTESMVLLSRTTSASISVLC